MGLLPETQNCGCTCAGNAGNVFPVTAGKRSRHASRHVRHARAVVHAGSFPLKSAAGENVPGIPGACATCNFYVSGKRPMETLAPLPALCEGTPPMTGGSHHKGYLMFLLMLTWTSRWTKNQVIGNLRHHDIMQRSTNMNGMHNCWNNLQLCGLVLVISQRWNPAVTAGFSTKGQ